VTLTLAGRNQHASVMGAAVTAADASSRYCEAELVKFLAKGPASGWEEGRPQSPKLTGV
jgi:hypothetical protein